MTGFAADLVLMRRKAQERSKKIGRLIFAVTSCQGLPSKVKETRGKAGVNIHAQQMSRISGFATLGGITCILYANYGKPVSLHSRKLVNYSRKTLSSTARFWHGRSMDGHKFESMEIIVDNEQELIAERMIALRPYPALKLFRDAMYSALKDKLPPDVWDYPTP